MTLFLCVVAAFVYDLLILAALSLLLSALFTLLAGEAFYQLAWITFIFQLCWLTMSMGYFGLSYYRGGQTIGMRAWRLRVCDDQGGPITARQALLRVAFGVLNLLSLGAGWLGYLSGSRRSLVDRFSHTWLQRLAKKDVK